MKKKKWQRHILFIIGILAFNVSFAQMSGSPITVKGNVKDAITGETLPGVSVTEKGNPGNGNATDDNGNFTVKVAPNSTLVFTYIGFVQKEVAVEGDKFLSVQMGGDDKMLDEVLVIGYGRVKKGDATGSVLAIKPDEVNKGNQVTVQNALQGKAAGVLVTNAGGAPGQGATIRIRGGSSLEASNDPLIIIDGVAIDNGSVSGAGNVLGSINPNDIESFSILKDASSTAIYGSRASNGVIIITTKKGSKGKPKISYSNNFSVSYNPKYLDVLSGDEFRSFVTENYPKYASGLGTENTDWQKEVFRTAFSQEHNVSVTGTAKNTPYRASVGYTNQNGTIKTSSYERLTTGISVSPQFFEKHLTVSANAKGSYENNSFINNPVGSSATSGISNYNNFIKNPVGAAIGFDPTRPIYSDASKHGSGYYIWTDGADNPITTAATNPLGLINLNKNNSKVYRVIGNGQLDYKVHGLEDLRLNMNYGFDILESKGSIFTPDEAPQTWTAIGNDGQGLDQNYKQEKRNTQLDLYANYVKELGIHNFDVMGGYSWQRFWNRYTNKEYTPDGNKEYKNIYNNPEYYLISFFGRLNYTLNNKYLFTATVRNDGSSRFAKDHRWGFFPSVAGAWKMNEESFIKDIDAISELKLRLSYGKTGQQDVGGYYEYQQTYKVSQPNGDYQLGDDFTTTIRPNGFDKNLKWETTSTYNVGLGTTVS